MARVTIESQAPTTTQSPLEIRIQEAAAIAGLLLTVSALLQPGLLVGAVFWFAWYWIDRPSTRLRMFCAAVLALPLFALAPLVVFAWPWRFTLAGMRSLEIEALAGPVWFEACFLVNLIWRRRVQSKARRDRRLDQRRWWVLSGKKGIPGMLAMLPDPQQPSQRPEVWGHQPDKISLGFDGETGYWLNLDLPADIASHVFLPGASGSGKTTTVARLADGVLNAGYAVVIIDCKGGSLGQTAKHLAQRYNVPFHLVDPDDPASLGYNPCSGDAAAVANKLVGAFTYHPSAEIYKNIAMEAIPVVVRGLQAAGQPVTLPSIYEAFQPRGLEKIAHAVDDEALRTRLLDLGGGQPNDRTGAGGRSGLGHRLGALLEGKFGDLFRAPKVLDWQKAFAEPSVTYVALSTLASSEDVELMGRVIAQDLKQVCAQRIRAETPPIPVLSVFDEFAALDEADQLADLLLQARQALMPTVISTQYLPETVGLRKACLGAGLYIVHRLESEDAETIAAQFGTRVSTEVTHQVDFAADYAEKGTIKEVDKYNVHPNDIRTFNVGQAAFKSVVKRRYTIVRVYHDPTL